MVSSTIIITGEVFKDIATSLPELKVCKPLNSVLKLKPIEKPTNVKQAAIANRLLFVWSTPRWGKSEKEEKQRVEWSGGFDDYDRPQKEKKESSNEEEIPTITKKSDLKRDKETTGKWKNPVQWRLIYYTVFTEWTFFMGTHIVCTFGSPSRVVS